MTKRELQDALHTAIVTENASALAIRNMASTFTWSGLSQDRRNTIMARLEDLAASAQLRAQRLKQLIARVQGSSQDVF